MSLRPWTARFGIALGAAILVAAAGCGGSTPHKPRTNDPHPAAPLDTASSAPTPAAPPVAEDTSTRTASAAPLAIVPFRIAVSNGRDKFDVELEDTGKVFVGGAEVGKIDGTGVVSKKGERVVDLAADGSLRVTGGEVMHLDENDEVVVANGTRVRIGNDGTFHFIRPDNKVIPGASIQVEGFTPAMRRTAIVILMGVARVQ
ncbi:MAG: hypothetical protein HOV80_34575 [Polyangiaceae bacterium]|nr:hypothetical protein [Polyangiaceae bacterium]